MCKIVLVIFSLAALLVPHVTCGQGAVTAPSPVAAPADGKWEFTIIPYLFAAGLKGDATVKGLDAKVDMSFGDILNNLKFGGMTYIEARKGKWAFFIDATYMNLSTNIEGARSWSGPRERRTAELLAEAKISMEQWAVELGGSYQLAKVPLGESLDQTMSLDLVAGGRYWNLRSSVDVGAVLDTNRAVIERSVSLSGSKQWIDPFIGLRTRLQLTKNVALLFRGDVGGFSVGSRFSWTGAGYFAYSFTDTVGLVAGYRVISVDYESGSGYNKFVYDMTMQGPAIGVSFRF